MCVWNIDNLFHFYPISRFRTVTLNGSSFSTSTKIRDELMYRKSWSEGKQGKQWRKNDFQLLRAVHFFILALSLSLYLPFIECISKLVGCAPYLAGEMTKVKGIKKEIEVNHWLEVLLIMDFHEKLCFHRLWVYVIWVSKNSREQFAFILAVGSVHWVVKRATQTKYNLKFFSVVPKLKKLEINNDFFENFRIFWK